MAKPNQLFKDAYNRCLLLLQEAPKLPPEPALAERLGVSRTTVRAILLELVHTGLLQWDKRLKVRLRPVEAADFVTEGETVPLATQIDDAVWRRLAASGVRPAVLNELAFARELGVGHLLMASTSSARTDRFPLYCLEAAARASSRARSV